jgi:ketose-bisphosphate aldolase
MSFVNPLPVVVMLVPVDDGLLQIRRGIEPGRGKWAFPGGFIDLGETWQEAGAREVLEETHLQIDPDEIREFQVRSAPDGTLLIFGLARPRGEEVLPPFEATDETTERLVRRELTGMAFELHAQAGEAFYKQHGKPLFSSHMIDLSEESLEENITICKEYLKRMSKIGMTLEIELGVTGGEEDGVDNTDVDNALLYTQPEDVAYAYEELRSVSDNFTIAASFGNVHGVYKPGNVKLTPIILHNSQEYIIKKYGTTNKPVNFVFHGGSGSSREEIREAITYGVIKMNIDTDTQWAFWDGVRKYEAANHDYLQGQIGNPEGDDKPNKKKYDPRVWLRAGEVAMVERLELAYEDLNCLDRN